MNEDVLVGFVNSLTNIVDVNEATDLFKELIKERKESLKTEIVEKAREIVEEGAIIKVQYKDEIVEGEVIAVREKTFTILIETIEGPKKIPRNFNAVII